MSSMKPVVSAKPAALGDRSAVAEHSFDAVEEPPRWAETHRRVVPCQRREFAAERRLVEGEHDEPESSVVAEPVEQRSQALDVVDRSRDVGSHVAAEALEHGGVVIAAGSGWSCITSPSSTLIAAISTRI